MKVIIINGRPGSGKSTFTALCSEAVKPLVHVYELSMVDFVKEVARNAGWRGDKTEEGRRFLADIKNAIERYDKNIIYNHIDNDIQSYGVFCKMRGRKSVFFINARNPSDIDYLVKKYNAISLFIDNPNVPMVGSNPEDKGVENYRYDVYIENDGTMDDFRAKAKKFMEEIVNAE